LPGNSFIAAMIAGDLTGATLKAIFVAHSHMIIYPLVDTGWTNCQAGSWGATPAAFLIDLDMTLLFVDLVFIQPQPGVES